MPHELLFREQYGASSDRKVLLIKPPDQKTLVQLHSTHYQTLQSTVLSSIFNFFRIVFLPQGYPDSVSKDYASYQLWDTLQAFCSSLNGTLTTQAIMKSVGVGDETATPLAAAVTWILKDGAGNIGRIIFAWWKGTSLDADCKKWRLCADILNDFAMLLELSLPFFMEYSTALLCFSTVLKSIVGVAGGATRAALTQHQAIRDNMADVSAKDGSQETCVNLLASVAGVALLMTVEKKQYLWCLFALFTFIHLYSNYRAVKALTMSTLNSSRLNIIIKSYLETEEVLNPEVVNNKEAVFLGKGLSARKLCGYNIKLGESVTNYVHNSALTSDQLKVLHHLYQDHHYILLLSQKQRAIFVLLENGISSNSSVLVKAYFHAILLGLATNVVETDASMISNTIKLRGKSVLYRLSEAVKTTLRSDSQGKESKHHYHHTSSINAIMASNQINSSESENFLKSLESSGWVTSGHHLGGEEWRFMWPKHLKESAPSGF